MQGRCRRHLRVAAHSVEYRADFPIPIEPLCSTVVCCANLANAILLRAIDVAEKTGIGGGESYRMPVYHVGEGAYHFLISIQPASICCIGAPPRNGRHIVWRFARTGCRTAPLCAPCYNPRRAQTSNCRASASRLRPQSRAVFGLLSGESFALSRLGRRSVGCAGGLAGEV